MLFSRLRRVLYRVADELKSNKIALDHHRDDILEIFFINMFFNGNLKSMLAKLQSDEGKHIVIRPMACVKEDDSSRYAAVKQLPIIPCNPCGSQENLQCKHTKNMLRDWDKKFSGWVESIFSALSTVVPSYLMGRDLFNFRKLPMYGVANPNGDIAFDDDPCAPSAATTNFIPLQRRP